MALFQLRNPLGLAETRVPPASTEEIGVKGDQDTLFGVFIPLLLVGDQLGEYECMLNGRLTLVEEGEPFGCLVKF